MTVSESERVAQRDAAAEELSSALSGGDSDALHRQYGALCALRHACDGDEEFFGRVASALPNDASVEDNRLILQVETAIEASPTGPHDEERCARLSRLARSDLQSVIAIAANPVNETVGRKHAFATLMTDELLDRLAIARLTDLPELSVLLSRLEATHGLGERTRRLRRAVRERAGLVQDARRRATEKARGGRRVRDFLADVPSGGDLLIPRNYDLDDIGVYRITRALERRRIAWAPLIVTGALKDAQSGEERLRILFRRDGSWSSKLVPRSRLATAGEIVALASVGAPVTSESAREMVRYVAAFEAINGASLPRGQTTTRLGWQGPDGQDGFLWGTTLIGMDGSRVEASADGIGDGATAAAPVTFMVDHDDGRQAFVRALTARGSLDGWRNVYELCVPYPVAVVGILASLASALLKFIPTAPGCVVHLWGETSRGKTTALRAAASVWGNPTSEELILTWSATRVGIERVLETFGGGLPVLLDDTQLAVDSKVVEQVLYDVVSGHGRLRGSPDGMRASGTWRAVLLSTGESAASSGSEAGGSRARCVEIPGAPFGNDGEESAKVVAAVTQGAFTNYGHVGPAFVERVAAVLREGGAEVFQRAYVDALAYWTAEAAGNPIANRKAATFALMTVAAEQFATMMGLDVAGPLESLCAVWSLALEHVVDEDPPTRALRQIRHEATSRQDEFWFAEPDHNDEVKDKKQPLRGWLGAWDPSASWTEMAFVTTQLKALLKNLGHEPDAISRAWYDRGWLRADAGRRDTKVVVDSDRARCTVILRSAFGEIGED